MLRYVLCLTILLATIFGGACEGVSEPDLTLPTSEDDPGEGLGGELEGVLRGDVKRGCLKVAGTPVVWPDGYRARADPPAVVGPSGETAALIGARVSLSGGYGEVGGREWPCDGEAVPFYANSVVASSDEVR